MHSSSEPDPADLPDARGDGEAGGEHESAYSLFQRGRELLGKRHHAQAATVLERAARLEPGKASILEALGRAYYNSGSRSCSRSTPRRTTPTTHLGRASSNWVAPARRGRTFASPSR
ncbi:MAG: hypothetical protein E6I45_11685 [Chloroflexi bacterium]|nr:MAG: hypothetical protein E6I45_11685 [Chloroflexota bacterium]